MPKPLIQTTGRRKEAVARVRLRPGTGKVTINRRELENYFPTATHRMVALEALRLTSTDEVYDVDATIDGGGVTGQAGALRLAIARALVELDPELRPDAEEGRPPHPRRAGEGEQEVRPQEGPQGSAVLQALTARPPVALQFGTDGVRGVGQHRADPGAHASPSVVPRRGSWTAIAWSSAATPASRARCSRPRWPPASPPRASTSSSSASSRRRRWPTWPRPRRSPAAMISASHNPSRRQRHQALRRRRPQALRRRGGAHRGRAASPCSASRPPAPSGAASVAVGRRSHEVERLRRAPRRRRSTVAASPGSASCSTAPTARVAPPRPAHVRARSAPT